MAEVKENGTRKRTKSVLKRAAKWLDSRMTQVNAISALIVAGATVVLAFLTNAYLKETKSQRLIAQRSIDLIQQSIEFEISPKPYIKDIETFWEQSESDENKLKGYTNIKLANCGRTEAKSIKLRRVLVKGSLTQDETISLLEYLYPGQEPIFSMNPISINDCSPQLMLAFKEAKKRGAQIGPQIPKDKQEPVTLEIELMYHEIGGNQKIVPYKFEYNYRLNKWVPAGFGVE